jgi:hypothetical protein
VREEGGARVILCGGECYYSTNFVDYLKKYGAGFGNMDQGILSLF